jgi:hypothetical protein
MWLNGPVTRTLVSAGNSNGWLAGRPPSLLNRFLSDGKEIEHGLSRPLGIIDYFQAQPDVNERRTIRVERPEI